MIELFSISVAVCLLIAVFYLIYKNRLKKQYSVLWIGLSFAILIFSIWRNGLEKLAEFFGVFYAPALLFMIAFLIIMVILIHLSVVISSLKDQVKVLSQEIAILKQSEHKDSE